MEQDLRAANQLFSGPCTFLLGVTSMEALPDATLAEIAFAGRSNVGKSSLLNALTGRNGLARTSNTPGRTRELNFFDLGARLRLVDLPGYGYARAGRAEVNAWTGLTRDYLRGRPNLRRVLLLIDSRHGIKPVDEETMAILDTSAVPYQIVLTKADKIKPTELTAVSAASLAALKRHPAAFPAVHACSAVTREGLDNLRLTLLDLADS